MTGRYTAALPIAENNWTREIWRGLATLDPNALPQVKTATLHPGSNEDSTPDTEAQDAITPPLTTQEDAVQRSTEEGEPTTEDKPAEVDEIPADELAFHIFELLDAVGDSKQLVDVKLATIPREDFLHFLALLILIAPLRSQEGASQLAAGLDEKRIETLGTAASCILHSFGAEQNLGIGYQIFEVVLANTLPHLFDSLAPLYERFLFPKDSGLSNRSGAAPDGSLPPLSDLEVPSTESASYVPEPLLPVQGDILDLNLLSQLSFVFSDKSIFHRVHPLYLGHKHGYSMGSFRQSVFKWKGPSFVLVSGTLLSPTTKQSRARTFLDDLPHRRLSSSRASGAPLPNSGLAQSSSAAAQDQESRSIIYGAYIPVPWEATDRATFGTDKTTLFQLSPLHDVFPASFASQNYVYFNEPPSTYAGLGFGSPLPNCNSMTTSQQSGSGFARRSSVTTYSASDMAYSSGSISGNSFSGPSSPGLARRSSLLTDDHIPLGPVSLHIDDGLEFGVFTHLTSGGGSFQCSKLPAAARPGNRGNWQDRFEIDAIEVWGVGGAIL